MGLLDLLLWYRLRQLGEMHPSLRHENDPVALRLEDPYLPQRSSQLRCLLREEPRVSHDIEEGYALRVSLLDEFSRHLVLVPELVLVLELLLLEVYPEVHRDREPPLDQMGRQDVVGERLPPLSVAVVVAHILLVLPSLLREGIVYREDAVS